MMLLCLPAFGWYRADMLFRSDVRPWGVGLQLCLTLTVLCCILGAVYSRDVQPQKETYVPDYDVYHNLSQIQKHLFSIVQHNPNYLKLDWSYTSREKRPQLLLRMTNFTDGKSHGTLANLEPGVGKVRILLSFGEHAREFLPIESLFFLLHNITKGLTVAEHDFGYIFSKKILSKTELFIVAILNPDGRNYLEKTRNYCWRGTSTGVDLNRNFDWNFGQRGSSGDRKDEEYRGPRPFSGDISRCYHGYCMVPTMSLVLLSGALSLILTEWYPPCHHADHTSLFMI